MAAVGGSYYFATRRSFLFHTLEIMYVCGAAIKPVCVCVWLWMSLFVFIATTAAAARHYHLSSTAYCDVVVISVTGKITLAACWSLKEFGRVQLRNRHWSSMQTVRLSFLWHFIIYYTKNWFRFLLTFSCISFLSIGAVQKFNLPLMDHHHKLPTIESLGKWREGKKV